MEIVSCNKTGFCSEIGVNCNCREGENTKEENQEEGELVVFFGFFLGFLVRKKRLGCILIRVHF